MVGSFQDVNINFKRSLALKFEYHTLVLTLKIYDSEVVKIRYIEGRDIS